MNFNDALSYGEQIEREVLVMIQKKYPKAHKIEGYCKEYDILIPDVGGVEVKSDQKSKYTGNIVVEIEYNGKPSALMTTKAKWWVFYTGLEYIWITPQRIRNCVETMNPVTFTGKGDTKEKRAYLVEKQRLIEQANRVTIPAERKRILESVQKGEHMYSDHQQERQRVFSDSEITAWRDEYAHWEVKSRVTTISSR